MVDKQLGQSCRALNQKQLELIKNIDDSIVGIERDIDAHKKGLGENGTEMQLIQILEQVKKMRSIFDSKVFAPSYPRMIVDSWDYNSTLAKKLLDLEEEYKKVTK